MFHESSDCFRLEVISMNANLVSSHFQWSVDGSLDKTEPNQSWMSEFNDYFDWKSFA